MKVDYLAMKKTLKSCAVWNGAQAPHQPNEDFFISWVSVKGIKIWVCKISKQ